jgi:hypothetical protein
MPVAGTIAPRDRQDGDCDQQAGSRRGQGDRAAGRCGRRRHYLDDLGGRAGRVVHRMRSRWEELHALQGDRRAGRGHRGDAIRRKGGGRRRLSGRLRRGGRLRTVRGRPRHNLRGRRSGGRRGRSRSRRPRRRRGRCSDRRRRPAARVRSAVAMPGGRAMGLRGSSARVALVGAGAVRGQQHSGHHSDCPGAACSRDESSVVSHHSPNPRSPPNQDRASLEVAQRPTP